MGVGALAARWSAQPAMLVQRRLSLDPLRVMTGSEVRIDPVVSTWIDVHVDVVQVTHGVQQVVTNGLGDIVAFANGEVLVDDDSQLSVASRCPTRRAWTCPTRCTPSTRPAASSMDSMIAGSTASINRWKSAGPHLVARRRWRSRSRVQRAGRLVEPQPRTDRAQRHGQRGEPVRPTRGTRRPRARLIRCAGRPECDTARRARCRRSRPGRQRTAPMLVERSAGAGAPGRWPHRQRSPLTARSWRSRTRQQGPRPVGTHRCSGASAAGGSSGRR